ncbi:MAG: hypothetical protein E7552_02980 [Ruminococcaceae bacterium]|nr:hypothetical protein [Oscillospiraceae bacterium]
MVNYNEIYALLGDLTPLTADCGEVCGAACCKGETTDGMLLFPDEAPHLNGDDRVMRENERELYVCNGCCDRAARPLSCRLFPLFPIITADGRIRAVYDPRAYRVCPLVQLMDNVRLDRRFVRAVRAVGRRLAATPEGLAFLKDQTAELQEMDRFLRLWDKRPPICRR